MGCRYAPPILELPAKSVTPPYTEQRDQPVLELHPTECNSVLRLLLVEETSLTEFSIDPADL